LAAGCLTQNLAIAQKMTCPTQRDCNPFQHVHLWTFSRDL